MGVRVVGLALLMMAGSSAPVCADNLYRWTDLHGQVHFSDRPPASGPPSTVEKLPRPQYADPGIPDGHYAVTQQWQRLQAERQARQHEQRERQRQARELALREREVAAAERAAAQAAVAPSNDHPVWVVPRRHPPVYRPGKPPRPTPYTGLWKPDHPAFRPRSRPQPRRDARPPGMRLGF